MPKSPEGIPANIRAEMARRGTTQQAVADKLGIDQARVSDRLNGKTKISADELVAIADLLEVPIALLIGEPERAAS